MSATMSPGSARPHTLCMQHSTAGSRRSPTEGVVQPPTRCFEHGTLRKPGRRAVITLLCSAQDGQLLPACVDLLTCRTTFTPVLVL